MTSDELDELVKKSLWKLAECDAIVSRIVISNRYKAMCLDEYNKYCKGTPSVYYGVPMEFADLPEYLVYYIESEDGGEE